MSYLTLACFLACLILLLLSLGYSVFEGVQRLGNHSIKEGTLFSAKVYASFGFLNHKGLIIFALCAVFFGAASGVSYYLDRVMVPNFLGGATEGFSLAMAMLTLLGIVQLIGQLLSDVILFGLMFVTDQFFDQGDFELEEWKGEDFD